MPVRGKALLARCFLLDPDARPTPDEAHCELSFLMDKLKVRDAKEHGNLLRSDKVLLQPLDTLTRCTR